MSVIYKTLNLKNFKIYRAAQIEFAQDPYFTLLIGDNSAGKTSILDALKWAWYGEVRSRLGIEVHNDTLVNKQAILENETDCIVELEFQNDSDIFKITRKHTLGETDSFFSLQINGNEQNPENGQIILQTIMPQNVSKFFLFDGEQLGEYEKLVGVRDASWLVEDIKQILGLPAVDNSSLHIKNLRKKANQEIRSLENKDQKWVQDQNILAQLEQTIENTEHQLMNWSKESEKVKSQLDLHYQEMQKTKDIAEKFKQQTDAEEKLNVYKARQKEIREQILKSSSPLWQDILQDTVDKRIDETLLEIEILENKLQSASTNSTVLKLISNHPDLSNDIKSFLEAHLSKGDVQDLETVSAELATKKTQHIVLTRLKPTGSLALVSDKEDEYTGLKNQINYIEQQLSKLRAFLKKADQEHAISSENIYNSLWEQKGIIDKEIETKNEDLIRLRNSFDELNNTIMSQPSNDPLMEYAKKKNNVYTELEAIFSKAQSSMIENLRGKIQDASTRYFLNLMNNDNYQCLAINEQFGLAIIDHNGHEIPMRSSGQEQLVSLALISALNNNAIIEAPLVLDTGFGRLDETRTKNSINHLRDLASQAILLIHDAEVSSEIIDSIEPYIGHKYKIEKSLEVEQSTITKI